MIVQRFAPLGILCNTKGDVLYVSGRVIISDVVATAVPEKADKRRRMPPRIVELEDEL